MRITALSGRRHLSGDTLDEAIAELVRTGQAGRQFGVEPAIDVPPGRQYVVIVGASSSDAIVVRPLILIFERM